MLGQEPGAQAAPLGGCGRGLRGSPGRPQLDIAQGRVGAGGSSYLVLCSSSRSQVGSTCPILYRSLESSMLWSR